uniref:Uncharacterized protein n=1 Tax=Oryza meridionalis TaxID=40149 RepID=A0A0E0DUL4_9ORYZ
MKPMKIIPMWKLDELDYEDWANQKQREEDQLAFPEEDLEQKPLFVFTRDELFRCKDDPILVIDLSKGLTRCKLRAYCNRLLRAVSRYCTRYTAGNKIILPSHHVLSCVRVSVKVKQSKQSIFLALDLSNLYCIGVLVNGVFYEPQKKGHGYEKSEGPFPPHPLPTETALRLPETSTAAGPAAQQLFGGVDRRAPSASALLLFPTKASQLQRLEEQLRRLSGNLSMAALAMRHYIDDAIARTRTWASLARAAGTSPSLFHLRRPGPIATALGFHPPDKDIMKHHLERGAGDGMDSKLDESSELLLLDSTPSKFISNELIVCVHYLIWTLKFGLNSDGHSVKSVTAHVAPPRLICMFMPPQIEGTIDGTSDLSSYKVQLLEKLMSNALSKKVSNRPLTWLVDDNFSTIVAAVGEGRSIYNNMKAFISYCSQTGASALLGTTSQLRLSLLELDFTFDDPCEYFRGGKVKTTLSLSFLVAIEMFNSLNKKSHI